MATKSISFKINPVKSGANSVIYNIIPSYNSISLDPNSNTISPSDFANATACTVTKFDGTTASQVQSSTFATLGLEVSIKFIANDGTVGATVTSGNYNYENLSANKGIRFELTQNGTLVDMETAAIVKNGIKGDPGIGIAYRGIIASIEDASFKGQGDTYDVQISDSVVRRYTWNSAKGDDGDWDQYDLTAPAGKDASQYYIHVAFAKDANGTNWSTTPGAGLTYMAVVANTNENAAQSDFEGKWVKFTGDDGYGFEYVYKLTSAATAPEGFDGSSASEFQNPDFIPTGWTDNPQDVSESNRFQWVMTRKYVNGVWQAFSSPTLFSTYGAQGMKGNDGAQGHQGSTGAQGEKGNTGAQGDKGNTGAQGDRGQQGSKGQQGDRGQQGSKGDSAQFYTFDLTNEMDGVLTDSEGKVISDTSLTTTAVIYKVDGSVSTKYQCTLDDVSAWIGNTVLGGSYTNGIRCTKSLVNQGNDGIKFDFGVQGGTEFNTIRTIELRTKDLV